MKIWLGVLSLFFCTPLVATEKDAAITFDQYKELLSHIQKENKYEGLIHVVPSARVQYEQKVKERPDTFDAYGAPIQFALKSVVDDKETKEERREKSAANAEDAPSNPNPKTTAHHKALVTHALKELHIERKLKHPELYPETSPSSLSAELSLLKKNRPTIPTEFPPLPESQPETETIVSHARTASPDVETMTP